MITNMYKPFKARITIYANYIYYIVDLELYLSHPINNPEEYFYADFCLRKITMDESII